MNLFSETYSAVRWMFSVLRVFMRQRPLITLMTLGFSVLSRVTSVLAFFLPLKAILLAGSEGIPKYFGYAVPPDRKLDLILVLSAAAVASYVLTLLLEGFSHRLAEAGSGGVLERARKLALTRKQRAQARSSYSRITQAVASAAFGFVGLGVLAFADLTLFTVLSIMFCAEFLVTSLVMAGWRAAHPGRLTGFIRDNLSGYLDILSSLNFLTSFLLILTPFLRGHGNVLMAVLAVVVIRRALPALEAAIRIVTELYRDRDAIDPLIFRKRRLRDRESVESAMAREHFNKTSRQALVQDRLPPSGFPPSALEVGWQDSTIKGAYTFVISVPGQQGRRYFQQQAFPASQAHLLAREDFLFATVKRARLHAPALITRFREGVYECQICEYGNGMKTGVYRYQSALPDLMADIWCLEPPKKLVNTFKTERPVLPERLTPELVDRLEVAVDSREESAALEILRARLPDICARLEQLPLYVVNPDLDRLNTVDTAGGDLLIMSWCRWAVEPIGAGIPEELSPRDLAELVRQVNAQRKDLQSVLTLSDIEFADACWTLEQGINQGRYKKALHVGMRIVGILSGNADGQGDA